MRYESSGYAEYFGVERNQNELKHFGIKGQKWGKRNGPPYPLDPEDHSAAEKKASNKSWGIKRSSKENAGNTKAADKLTQKSNTELLKNARSSADDETVKKIWENIFDPHTGTPKSENVKSLFEEDPSYYQGDNDNFVPKYLKSSKYMALSKQQDDMRKKSRVDEKAQAFYTNKDPSKADKLYKAWDKAGRDLYSNFRYRAIESKKMKMADDFDRQFAIAILKDMGFDTSRENIEEISRLIVSRTGW